MSEPTEEQTEQPKPARRPRKTKAYGSLASQGDTVEPATTTELPTIPAWEEGTLRLQQLVQRIEGDLLEFCVWAKRAIAEQWYTRFGYVDPAPYFQDKIGISYRSVRRRLSILEAVEKLPEAEQDEAKRVLAGIGAHKAASIAPLVGVAPDWRDFVEFAKISTEDAVQAAVSDRLEAKPRGAAAAPGASGSPSLPRPGDRFLGFIVNQMPPDRQEDVAATFKGMMKLFEMTNAVAVFLVMVDITKNELAAHGIEVDAPASAAAPQ